MGAVVIDLMSQSLWRKGKVYYMKLSKHGWNQLTLRVGREASKREAVGDKC